MKGFIKVGRHTRSHGNNLKSLGYEVKITELFVEVEVSKVLTSTDLIDLQSNPDRLKEVVKAKEGISYATPIRFKNGQIHTGIRACQGLESISKGLSCLVMTASDKSSGSDSDNSQSLKALLGV